MNKILPGSALEKLKELSSRSVNMCMTSPPYWALRDYGVKGQLGLEPTFNLYIKHLCDIFDEVKRVLRDDGTCWVNMGDTYMGGGGGNYGSGISSKQGNSHETNMKNKPEFIRANKIESKSLVMIPFHFAIEMVNRGWILRNTIIWYKRNCMPSSAKDRFTIDFEYLFFFSKKKKYYFETQYEPMTESTKKRYKSGWDGNTDRDYPSGSQNHLNKHIGSKHSQHLAENVGRVKRTVWTINPTPFGDNLGMNCGYFDKPKSKQQQKGYFGGEDKSESICKSCGKSLITSHFAVYPEELCETPIKAGCPEGGIVLDPFFGAGTTGLVALKQNKKFIGIELNPEYIKIAEERLKPFLEQRKLK